MVYDVIVTSVSGKKYNCIYNDVSRYMSGREIVKELCSDTPLELKAVDDGSTVFLNTSVIETIELKRM